MPVGYKPTSISFRLFYEALLDYRKNFLLAYEILADGVDISIIPPTINKDFGLIHIYINKIPFSYGKKHFSRMGRLSGKKRRNKAIKQAVFWRLLLNKRLFMMSL